MKKRLEKGNNMREKSGKALQDIYFAGGCFWGTEKYFKLIEGVEEPVTARVSITLTPTATVT